MALDVDTPDGRYAVGAEWLIACDGAQSPIRSMLGLDFVGRVFEDSFLIADVVMEADFPTERWFWFDPPFNRGHSALLHKQPDNLWRIDLQLGWNIDRKGEAAGAGDPAPQGDARRGCRLRARMGVDLHLPVPAHGEVPPRAGAVRRRRGASGLAFGARGANSGLQDTDNLVWKLKLVRDGLAPESLLDSYDAERVRGADKNILHSSRSTDFITPKSEMSRLFATRRSTSRRATRSRGRSSIGPTVDALHL